MPNKQENKKQETNEQKGSFKLLDGEKKTALPFIVNPKEFNVSKAFNYEVEPLLGKSKSVVSYASSSPSRLEVVLTFNDDTTGGAKTKCDDVLDFFKDAATIVKEIKSVPRSKFKMGGFSFEGHIINYHYRPTSFDSGCNIKGLEVHITMISTGEF
jgi:hypothetical protein